MAIATVRSAQITRVPENPTPRPTIAQIESELDFETQPGAPKCRYCPCGNRCRSLYCADCLLEILDHVLDE
jgi:hypothetical protein